MLQDSLVTIVSVVDYETHYDPIKVDISVDVEASSSKHDGLDSNLVDSNKIAVFGDSDLAGVDEVVLDAFH